MADKIRMGAGGVPYKAKSEEPKKDEVISEVLVENPNKKHFLCFLADKISPSWLILFWECLKKTFFLRYISLIH